MSWLGTPKHRKQAIDLEANTGKDTKTHLQSRLDPRLDVCIMLLGEKASTNCTAE